MYLAEGAALRALSRTLRAPPAKPKQKAGSGGLASAQAACGPTGLGKVEIVARGAFADCSKRRRRRSRCSASSVGKRSSSGASNGSCVFASSSRRCASTVVRRSKSSWVKSRPARFKSSWLGMNPHAVSNAPARPCERSTIHEARRSKSESPMSEVVSGNVSRRCLARLERGPRVLNGTRRVGVDAAAWVARNQRVTRLEAKTFRVRRKSSAIAAIVAESGCPGGGWAAWPTHCCRRVCERRRVSWGSARW